MRHIGFANGDAGDRVGLHRAGADAGSDHPGATRGGPIANRSAHAAGSLGNPNFAARSDGRAAYAYCHVHSNPNSHSYAGADQHPATDANQHAAPDPYAHAHGHPGSPDQHAVAHGYASSTNSHFASY